MIDYTQIQKPQQYIGNEWNVVKKNHDGKITVCISYPDAYAIGMSNLGLRIIYGLLNEASDVVCERVFLPGQDFIGELLAQKNKLFSLETKTPLDSFEVIGFNLSCELNFINFLKILYLGGLALKSSERPNTIVMGGGLANPEPLAEFVDCFYLGEFESGAQSFLEVLRKYKDKESRLKALSEIEGFYVPRFYVAKLSADKYCFERTYHYASFPLRRAYVKDLNSAYYPRRWLIPHTPIVHDRVQIEIARGCPNRCTFCQARSLYYPYRERKPEIVGQLIKAIYETSGYENFSLLSLSASDYSSIESLIDETIGYFSPRKIGLSLPSLHIDDIIGGLYKKLIPLKKTSLTCALEVARDDLRSKLNKKIDTSKLFEAAAILRALNIRHLKIYFMFGFPGETEEDLAAIGDFLQKLMHQTKIALHVSVNAFVPKPFSSWESVPMAQESELILKRSIILKHIPAWRSISVTISPIKRTLLEAILCRAPREFSKVIHNVLLKELKSSLPVNSPGDSFWWDRWKKAMEEEGFDYRPLLEASSSNFPWSFIEKGAGSENTCSKLQIPNHKLQINSNNQNHNG
ncbi:MAG: radical SAM protein [Candidatus Omnitrophica bacterium]|nr:radical SAM protein [Candidatus Omnitrophota bacterium]